MQRTEELRRYLREDKFFGLSDIEAIHVFGDAFNPELQRLKNASEKVESNIQKGHNVPDNLLESPSIELYGENYVEINRTLISMLALKWLMNNNYESFTCQQISLTKLRPESFSRLRSLFREGLQSADDIYALLVATMVNDVGKDPDLFKEVVDKVGESAIGKNHDMVAYIAAEAQLIPLIGEFASSTKEDIMLGLQFGSGLNAAQLAQAENVPANLKGALVMKGHGQAFALKYMELLLDVAGADGHMNTRCAKALSEPTFQALMTSRQVLQSIVSGSCDLRTGYDQVLAQRGKMLEAKGFTRLSVSIDSERALLRLLTMSRTASLEQAELIDDAFRSLSEKTKKALVAGLSVDGYNDGVAILPYYIPALFAETISCTSGSQVIQIAALASLMRLLTRVYHDTKPNHGCAGEVVECDMSFAFSTIKSEAFKADPGILDGVFIPKASYSKDIDSLTTASQLGNSGEPRTTSKSPILI